MYAIFNNKIKREKRKYKQAVKLEYKKCVEEIRDAHGKGKQYVKHIVPIEMPTIPGWDYEVVVYELIQKLRKDLFNVYYLHPCRLIIVWANIEKKGEKDRDKITAELCREDLRTRQLFDGI